MQTKYDELARLAEAAETNRYWSEDDGTRRYGLAPGALEDFAKAADPETIRTLVSDLRESEVERSELHADLVKAQADRDALAAALEKIVAWPDGGNHYGQSNIKQFASAALASMKEEG